MPNKAEIEGMVDSRTVILPKKGLRITVYHQFIQDMQGKTERFDRSLGYVSWVTGKILLLARPACKKRGSWSQFLNGIKVGPSKSMKPGTARLLMKIAEKIDEGQAKLMAYTAMLALVYPDTYGKDIKSTEEEIVTGKGKKKKRKVNPTEIKPLSATAYESVSVSLSRQAQKLTAGFLDGGKRLSDEIKTLKNAQRCITASRNDLGTAAKLLQKRIDSLSLTKKKTSKKKGKK